METVNIVAGIVTYNPDLGILKQNISAVSKQVDLVFIVDNHSSNINRIKDVVANFDNVELILRDENEGIARALNILCDKGCSVGASWILTLDQDTIIPSNLIMEYSKFLSVPNIGLIGCHIVDRNIDSQQLDVSTNDYPNTLITSGSFTNLSVWNRIGGFCEKLFIDGVDHAYCFNLRKNGFKILRLANVKINHAIGKSKLVNFNKKQMQLYGESPLRYYYMYRNNIYLLREYNDYFLEPYKYGIISYVYSTVVYLYLMLRYEDSGLLKLCMIIKGCIHGIMGRYGKYER